MSSTWPRNAAAGFHGRGCHDSRSLLELGQSDAPQSTASAESKTGGGAVALARQRAAEYEKTPDSALSKLPPLNSKAASGKTIVEINTPIPQGVAIRNGIKAAAAAVAWHYKAIDIDQSNPSTSVAAIDGAIEQHHASVVSITGVTESQIRSTFPTAVKAGVTIIANDYVDPPGGPVAAVIDGPPSTRKPQRCSQTGSRCSRTAKPTSLW
jgi:hypothetical protein